MILRTAGVVGLAAIVAAGGCKLGHPKIDYGCGQFAVSAEGATLAYTDREGVHLRRGKRLISLPYSKHRCLRPRADLLYLFPDGWRAIVYGKRANMPFDLFGHAGRRVEVSCLVDFRKRTATPLRKALPGAQLLTSARKGKLRVIAGARSGYLYSWWDYFDVDAIEVLDRNRKRRHDIRLANANKHCVLREAGKELLVACVDDRGKTNERLVVRHYGLERWPPALVRTRRIRLSARTGPSRLSLGPGGRFLAFGGSRHYLAPKPPKAAPVPASTGRLRSEVVVGLVDLAVGRELFSTSGSGADNVTALAFHPGPRRLLVAREKDRKRRVEIWDDAGKLRSTIALKHVARRIYPIGSSSRFWSDSGCEASLVDTGRR